MKNGYPEVQILDEILERYRTEMLDSTGSLGLAIYEFYSEIQNDNNDNILLKQYEHSVTVWKDFLSYGIQRGEFKNVESDELVDIIIFSYQGVRMLSEVFPVDEKVSARIINHIKRVLLD